MQGGFNIRADICRCPICKHIVAFWMNFTFEQTCGLTRFNIREEFENAQNEGQDIFCIFRGGIS